MTTVTRKLIVFCSFTLNLYMLNYTSLLLRVHNLLNKHDGKEETYTNSEEASFVRFKERERKAKSEYMYTKVPINMANNSLMMDDGIKPISNKSLDSLEENSHLVHPTAATVVEDYNTYFVRSRNVQGINCIGIFNGSESEINRVVSLSKSASMSKGHMEAERYIYMTKTCETFIQDRGYITSHLSEEERYFPIAYSILMYNYVEQMERLLRAIYRPQNVYCIHVDAKTENSIYQAVIGITNCFENVFVASKRFNVVWGTMTVLEPELQCMRELWKRNTTWKYFINLTGQELPLRTNFELVKILTAYNGSNDVASKINEYRDRWERAPPPPHGIVPTKGAVHVAVNRGFVDYILHDQRASDILAWVNQTQIPDETFFSTLNHNPKLGVQGSYQGYPQTTPVLNKTKPFLARFKNFKASNLPCNGNWVRGICIFSIGDLQMLAQRKELFANKYHLDEEPYAYGCMEELIFNRTRDEYLGTLTFDASWYASLGFVLNKIE